MACFSSNHYQKNQNGFKKSQVAVLMVPLPAQGHLHQLLHLSRLIAAYNIPVHYATTATHNRQVKLRSIIDDRDSLVHFHEFPNPEFQSPPPNPNSNNKFPSHLQPLFDSLSYLRLPVFSLLLSLSPTAHRVIVIHDSLMSSVVQDFSSISNAESYVFHSVSAFAMFGFFRETKEKSFPVEDKILEKTPSLENCFTIEFLDFIATEHKFQELSSGILYNSCKVIEGQYINLLEKALNKGNKKYWPIGPFNPVELANTKNGNGRHKCLEWLDKQAPKSVVYVSFGTTTSLTDGQIKELKIGLERSEVKFIWVLRDADRGDIFAGETSTVDLPHTIQFTLSNTPEAYEEKVRGLVMRDSNTDTPEGTIEYALPNTSELYDDRIRDRGIVVRDWAPQLEILRHPSTGGFMSHCGWNSCMESITMGVPIAAWPMHSDQPRNSILITEVLKIGLSVKNLSCQDETVDSSTISKVLKTLMGSKEGDEIRQRAAELGVAVRESVAEGGATRMELDSFIAHISR
ncbi:unnamed protein product [Fraxinus pennsylvanica]|uniref:Glycosyltransferase n=1 Tax=Fraxinus pennsylvanica TaxID=56036 RepID=A0AAD2DTK2_9LAMI|nr:unnamed protein product [Fraxinus pennsylvanica]